MSDKKRVLIVDDEKHICKGLEEALEDTYETKIAHNGKQAIEILEDENFDLVIMDMMMPEMDGNAAIFHIMDQNLAPKVIAISGVENRKNHLERAKRFGAITILEKPFKINKLKKMIKKVI